MDRPGFGGAVCGEYVPDPGGVGDPHVRNGNGPGRAFDLAPAPRLVRARAAVGAWAAYAAAALAFAYTHYFARYSLVGQAVFAVGFLLVRSCGKLGKSSGGQAGRLHHKGTLVVRRRGLYGGRGGVGAVAADFSAAKGTGRQRLLVLRPSRSATSTASVTRCSSAPSLARRPRGTGSSPPWHACLCWYAWRSKRGRASGACSR